MRGWHSSLLRVCQQTLKGFQGFSARPPRPTCLTRWGQEVWCSCQQTGLSQVLFPAPGPHQSSAALILSERLTQWQAGDLANTAASVLRQVLFVSSSYRGGRWQFSLKQENGTGESSIPRPRNTSLRISGIFMPRDRSLKGKKKSHLVLFKVKAQG